MGNSAMPNHRAATLRVTFLHSFHLTHCNWTIVVIFDINFFKIVWI